MAPSALERGATAILEALGRRLWGFPPRLMAPIVAELGPLRALGWFARNMPRYERTMARIGEVRTHLLCVAISLLNGCPYCTYGHGYALGLAFLQDYGQLFPLDEAELDALVGARPALIRYRLVRAAQQAGLHVDALWLDRTITMALAPDHRPIEPAEIPLAHLIDMFAVLNHVGITSRTPPDQAHSPLNKNLPLKLRYATLRAASAL
jgi:alkylhydroperoxidase family enzyme